MQGTGTISPAHGFYEHFSSSPWLGSCWIRSFPHMEPGNFRGGGCGHEDLYSHSPASAPAQGGDLGSSTSLPSASPFRVFLCSVIKVGVQESPVRCQQMPDLEGLAVWEALPHPVTWVTPVACPTGPAVKVSGVTHPAHGRLWDHCLEGRWVRHRPSHG